jgi:hypothetical protein
MPQDRQAGCRRQNEADASAGGLASLCLCVQAASGARHDSQRRSASEVRQEEAASSVRAEAKAQAAGREGGDSEGERAACMGRFGPASVAQQDV